MTELELRKVAEEVKKKFRAIDVMDEEIISQIKAIPEVIHVTLLLGANLFLESVLWDRFSVTQMLGNMRADVHWRTDASMIRGNALNVAHSPEQANYLLGLGLKIERNLSTSLGYINPAIMSAYHNDKTMLVYWINLQKEVFADDKIYVNELINEVIEERYDIHCYMRR